MPGPPPCWPNNISKKSLNPPASPPWKLNPPPPGPCPGAGPGRKWEPNPGGGSKDWPCFQFAPSWSYRLRFSGSDKTSYASFASENFLAAPGSSLFLSGWYLLASLRYARLIASAETSRDTPRVL